MNSSLTNSGIRTKLIPESAKEWLKEEELVSLVLQAIAINEDLKESNEILGNLFFGYQPKMLLAVLVASYASGIYGSDAIELAFRNENDLAYLSAGTFPDADTLRQFRRFHPQTILKCLSRTLRYALDHHAQSIEYGPNVRFGTQDRLTVTPDFDLDAYLDNIAAERIRTAISADSALLDD